MLNLKKALMELGNELVLEHGYEPATGKPTGSNTVPIKAFTDFLNDSPEARVILHKLGLEWPTAIVPPKDEGFNPQEAQTLADGIYEAWKWGDTSNANGWFMVRMNNDDQAICITRLERERNG